MKTWTAEVYGRCFVVTADHVRLAVTMIEDDLISSNIINPIVENKDLVPLPTHHRYLRQLTPPER